LRFLRHSDGKIIKGTEALFTTLLDGRNVNEYAENLQT
jgi:sulfur transfer protein SufE